MNGFGKCEVSNRSDRATCDWTNTVTDRCIKVKEVEMTENYGVILRSMTGKLYSRSLIVIKELLNPWEVESKMTLGKVDQMFALSKVVEKEENVFGIMEKVSEVK